MKTLKAGAACLFLLAGCASPKLTAPSDYPQLFVSPDDSNVLLFTRPDLDLSGYRKILLEPTEFRTQDETGVHAPIDAGASELAAYVDQRLRDELSKSFELVDAPAAPAAPPVVVGFRSSPRPPARRPRGDEGERPCWTDSG